MALIGNNRRDWVISQMGISAAAAVPAPIYVTNTVDQVAYIVKHCRAKVAICDQQDQLDKYLAALDRGLIELDHIITMDPIESERDNRDLTCRRHRSRRPGADDEVERRMAAVQPDDLALLIYTSGTTGVPKGAMCTHRGIDAMGQAFVETYPELIEIDPSRYVSYLPSVPRRRADVHQLHGAARGQRNVLLCRPGEDQGPPGGGASAFFFAVPRVWEKFEAALGANLLTATGLKAKLTEWARRVELESSRASIETGKEVDTFQRRLANKLVISKIKSAIGLDELVGAGSGAAPAALSTLEFFASIGVPFTRASA